MARECVFFSIVLLGGVKLSEEPSVGGRRAFVKSHVHIVAGVPRNDDQGGHTRLVINKPISEGNLEDDERSRHSSNRVQQNHQ